MITHLLDTSVYCQVLKPIPIPAVRERWTALGDARLAVSVICEAEVLYGLKLKNSAGLLDKFDRLLRGRLPMLPVNAEVAERFAAMKARQHSAGRQVSDFDLLIAATAAVHRLIVATLNHRDFAAIHGVAVEDWSLVPHA